MIYKEYLSCCICPRSCGINRYEITGRCGAGHEMSVSKIMLHRWEEPPVSGYGKDDNAERGSGAIFFTHCPLGCVYCQNNRISSPTSPDYVYSPEALACEMLTLEKSGAYNINLVSPTHYTPNIIKTVALARERGLSIPIIWNTGGYETSQTIHSLLGTVDIFLTDYKYHSPELSKKYSAAEDYPKTALSALCEMYAVAGKAEFDSDGMMKKGVIVRHLVLPSHRNDSISALCDIANTVPIEGIRLSLMAQYTPDFLADKHKYPEIARKITSYEYDSVVKEAIRLGFEGYIQERSSATKRFTPDF